MNKTGIKPVEYKVLIEVDKIDPKSGLVWKPETTMEREQYAHDRGRIVEVGEMAFSDWHGKNLPKVGDRVIFAKYEGVVIPIPEKIIDKLPNGDTREKIEWTFFRIGNDKDILGIFMETEDGTAS